MDKRLTLMELGELRRSNIDTIRKCQEWGLLPHEGTYNCPKCGGTLKFGVASKTVDGYHWMCNSKQLVSKRKVKKCNTTISIRTKTFFEKSRLSIVQILAFASMWVQSCKIRHIQFEINIACQTTADWASFCREVAYKSIVLNGEKLGGDEKFVVIDESKFVKRKSNAGRRIPDKWVYGGYERGSGKVFMEAVPNRTEENLLKIIKKWIRPGTKIISDCWRTYENLSNKVYQYQNVNKIHTLHFVDPETGTHTNNIELVWDAAKIAISPQNRKAMSLPGNFARYLLNKKAKALGRDPVLYFYEMAGKIYNPLIEGDVESEEEVEYEEVEDEQITGEDNEEIIEEDDEQIYDPLIERVFESEEGVEDEENTGEDDE